VYAVQDLLLKLRFVVMDNSHTHTNLIVVVDEPAHCHCRFICLQCLFLVFWLQQP